MKHYNKTIISLATLCAAGTVYATGAGFYLGGTIGESYSHNGEKNVLLSNGTTTLVRPSNTGIGGRGFMGYGFNQYAAVEGGFTHYATSTYSVPNQCGSDPQIYVNGVDLVAKGMFPVYMVSAFGKAGASYMRTNSSKRLNGSTLSSCGGSSSEQSYVRPTAAVGISYDISQNWVADISYSHVFGGSGIPSADLFGLGISYHFVDKYCGQFLC